jgi:hypothetical protein
MASSSRKPSSPPLNPATPPRPESSFSLALLTATFFCSFVRFGAICPTGYEERVITMPPIHVVLTRPDPSLTDNVVASIKKQYLNVATVSN